jgi:hypothetical protein
LSIFNKKVQEIINRFQQETIKKNTQATTTNPLVWEVPINTNNSNNTDKRKAEIIRIIELNQKKTSACLLLGVF